MYAIVTRTAATGKISGSTIHLFDGELSRAEREALKARAVAAGKTVTIFHTTDIEDLADVQFSA